MNEEVVSRKGGSWCGMAKKKGTGWEIGRWADVQKQKLGGGEGCCERRGDGRAIGQEMRASLERALAE